MANLKKDMYKAVLAEERCFSYDKERRVDETTHIDDSFYAKNAEMIYKFSNMLLSNKYNVPIDGIHRDNQFFEIIDELMSNTPANIIDNEKLSSFIFNHLSTNYNWNDWSVFVNNIESYTEKQHDTLFKGCQPECENVPPVLFGSGIEIHRAFKSKNINIVLLWKPSLKNRKPFIHNELWLLIYKYIQFRVWNEVNEDLYDNKVNITKLATDAVNSVLDQANLTFCSSFSIVHQIIIKNKVLFDYSKLASRFNMPSLDSRIFVIELGSQSNATIEMFIDVGACHQGKIVNANTNVNSTFSGYKYLLQMPTTELAINGLETASDIISAQLTKFYRSLWSVTIFDSLLNLTNNITVGSNHAKLHLGKCLCIHLK